MSATTYDANSASTTAIASAPNRNRLTPNRNVTGKKTTMVVSVAASTGIATSRPPCSAATSGGSPASKWRKMFSSTSSELKSSRVNASASPPSTIVLTELPPSDNARNAASAESGTESRTASVARGLARNRSTITDVSANPKPGSDQQSSNRAFDELRLVEYHARHQLARHVQQPRHRVLNALAPRKSYWCCRLA